MLEGFEKLHDEGQCVILVSEAVSEFFNRYAKKNKEQKRQVLKVVELAKKLSAFGPQYLNNKEQFKREERLPSGRKGGGQVAVYAFKAFKLRVYGGFVSVGEKQAFLCIETAQKKKNSADRKQLERVAQKLGECNGWSC